MENLPYLLTAVTLSLIFSHLFYSQISAVLHRSRQAIRRQKLLKILNEAQGHVFCDVIIPADIDCEAIDFVLICRKGVYLINIHYWRGKVFGLPHASELVLNDRGKNAKFNNPFYQWHEVRRHLVSHLPVVDTEIVHPVSCFINAQVVDDLPFCMTGIKEMRRFFRQQPEVLTESDISHLTCTFKQYID